MLNLQEYMYGNHIEIPETEISDIGEVSDGFHTFNSLYRQRLILLAALVNTFPDSSWKSHFHDDGKAPYGGGWFIVGINSPEGPYTYYFKDENWELFHCTELNKAPELDGHTGKDVDGLYSIISENEFGNMSNWAKKEIELAIETEKEAARNSDDWQYGAACYESAYRAFCSLLRDDHSGMSIQITKSILNRLIDGKCMTPIEDTSGIWSDITTEGSEYCDYQCIRMSSLFKRVAPDGTISYSDINRVLCVDIDNPTVSYQNGFATRFVDKLFPIQMPYLPAGKPFKLFRKDFLVDSESGDYDTIAFLYILTPEGRKVDLYRFFKDDGSGKLIQIGKEEYEERKKKCIDSKKEAAHDD